MKMYPSRSPAFNLLASFAFANPMSYAIATPHGESDERGKSVHILSADEFTGFFDGSADFWEVEIVVSESDSYPWSWYFAISPDDDLEHGYAVDYATGDHPLDDFYAEVGSPE